MEQTQHLTKREREWLAEGARIYRKPLPHEAALRAGSFREEVQPLLSLDMNTTTNSDLPLPPDAQRFQIPTLPPEYTPTPPQVPEDPNEYFRPAHKPRQPSVATLYRRDLQLFLRTRYTSNIDLPDTITPAEQDYLDNVHALFPE